jgi:hypothetical protein
MFAVRQAERWEVRQTLAMAPHVVECNCSNTTHVSFVLDAKGG